MNNEKSLQFYYLVSGKARMKRYLKTETKEVCQPTRRREGKEKEEAEEEDEVGGRETNGWIKVFIAE